MKAWRAIAVACFFVALSGNPAAAQPQSPSIYVYRINLLRTTQPLTVWVTATVRPDSCNTMGIAGGFRKVEILPGTQTLDQDFVADVTLATTLMGCAPGTAARPEQVLTSRTLVINPHPSGIINSRIYVPVG